MCAHHVRVAGHVYDEHCTNGRRPCTAGFSDCYVYHHIDHSTFTPHLGAHSFSWGGTDRPPVRNVSAHCNPTPPTPTLCGHDVVLDADQKIMPWSTTNASAGGAAGAYEYSARLVWNPPYTPVRAPAFLCTCIHCCAVCVHLSRTTPTHAKTDLCAFFRLSGWVGNTAAVCAGSRGAGSTMFRFRMATPSGISSARSRQAPEKG